MSSAFAVDAFCVLMVSLAAFAPVLLLFEWLIQIGQQVKGRKPR